MVTLEIPSIGETFLLLLFFIFLSDLTMAKKFQIHFKIGLSAPTDVRMLKNHR